MRSSRMLCSSMTGELINYKMSDPTNTRLLEDCAKALQNTEAELAELKRRYNQERRGRESLEREKADLRRSEHFAKSR